MSKKKQNRGYRPHLSLTPFQQIRLTEVALKMEKPLASVAADIVAMVLRGELVDKKTGETYEASKKWQK